MFENKKIKKMQRQVDYLNSKIKDIDNELFSLRHPNGSLYISVDTDKNKKSVIYTNIYAKEVKHFYLYSDITGGVKVFFCEKFNTHLLRIDTDSGSRFVSINKETGSKYIFGDGKEPTEKLEWIELKPIV